VGLTFWGTQLTESLEITSMFRIRNNAKRWRMKWPWRLFFPLRVDERFCRECGMPYHEGPLPKETERYRDGDVEALLFPAGGYHRGEHVVRFGRWKGGGQKFYFSEFIPENELDSVITVAMSAREEYRLHARSRRARR
jgi:hypothetical protein